MDAMYEFIVIIVKFKMTLHLFGVNSSRTEGDSLVHRNSGARAGTNGRLLQQSSIIFD